MFLPVNYFVLPLFAGQIADHSLLTAIQIGVIFSTISLVRKFVIRRRWFERMRKRKPLFWALVDQLIDQRDMLDAKIEKLQDSIDKQ